ANLSYYDGDDTVTAGLADAFHETFATDLGQIVGRVSGVVVFKFRSGDFRHFPGQIGDRKTVGLGSQSDDCRHHLAHADFVEIDSGLPSVSTLSRRRQSIEGSLIQKRHVSRL